MKKKIPLISNAYLPQNIIDQAQIAKIKVYKVIRDSKTNFKFDVKEKNILGKDIEFEKVNCLEIINDNNFEKKLTEIAENYFLKE